MQKLLFSLIAILFCVQSVTAKHIYSEKDYQNYWCTLNCGQMEFRISDGTRVDCITNDYAIEFDFANKWSESVGQSLFYAISTNKKPGIVLIIEDTYKDIKYLKRLNTVADYYNIKIWTIGPETITNNGFSLLSNE